MTQLIKGLHHVTATVNDAREDVHFYSNILGLRLVKETVNFDNESVYHFYYGNEIGLPSTIFTTFPYKGQGISKGVIGSGQVYETVFSVPAGAFVFWKKRLENHDISVDEEVRFDKKFLLFEDPSGLKLAILEDSADRRDPVWETEEISRNEAILGVHHVTLAVEDPGKTVAFLENFGYQSIQTDGTYTLLVALGSREVDKKGENDTSGDDSEGNVLVHGAGNSIVVMAADGLPAGINGLGTVHHVAHRVETLDDSRQIKSELEKEHGIRVTEIKDRKYFKSIYFRIPGGVLFEVATEEPGFLVDEDREALGSSLKLPDWQEPRRNQIEAGLEPFR